LAELGIENEKPPPPAIPLAVARGIAGIGEWVAQFTHRPPLLPKGGLYFLQWGAFPQNEKAQRELGWKPTPLREGLRKTIAYMNRQSRGSDTASG